MDIDRLKKQTEELQKKAAEIHAARQAAKQHDADEALLTRIAEREAAASYNMKATADIIATGTPEEKAALYIAEYEMSCNGKGKLTAKQKKGLATFSNEDEMYIFKSYLNLYDDLHKYGSKLAFVYQMYQIEVAEVASLLTKWDNYDGSASFATLCLASLSYAKKHGTTTGMKYSFTDKSQVKALDETTPDALLEEWNSSNLNPDVTYKREGETVVADIYQDGGLYSTIQNSIKSLTKLLSQLKAYVVTIDAYIGERKYLLYAPDSLLTLMVGIKGEAYARRIIGKSFLKSELNRCKEQGKAINAQQEIKAVFPDYKEIEADKDTIQYCLYGINLYRHERR